MARADLLREALLNRGAKPCIPGRPSRGTAIQPNRRRSRRRHRVKMMLGRLKDRQRVATRYNRCPIVLLSAIASAATAMWTPAKS